jgi:membrane fusion protein, copper/silver efflux system
MEPKFKIREIGLGPQLGNSYVVTDGLREGEEIVTEGAFSVDAAAQLEGKPSMLNQENNSSKEASQGRNAVVVNNVTKRDIITFSVKVAGNCEMCKDRIETTAKSIAGVESAEWNVETKQLHLKFDGTKTNSDTIQMAIAQAGHDTEKFKAPDDAYNKLPECCLYRK